MRFGIWHFAAWGHGLVPLWHCPEGEEPLRSIPGLKTKLIDSKARATMRNRIIHHIHTCIYIYICIYIYTYISIYIYTYICGSIMEFVEEAAQPYKSLSRRLWFKPLPRSIHKYMHTYVHTYRNTYEINYLRQHSSGAAAAVAVLLHLVQQLQCCS